MELTTKASAGPSKLRTDQYQFAQVAYEAYCKARPATRSFATGVKLPPFDDLSQEIKDAWTAAAEAVKLKLFRVEFSGEFFMPNFSSSGMNPNEDIRPFGS